MESHKRILTSIILSVLLGLSLCFAAPVFAQQTLHLRIDSIANTDFPIIQALVTITDAHGMPVPGLTAANISASEERIPVANLNVSPVYQAPVDIALLIDTSGTMEYGVPPTELSKTIQAVNEFVAALPAQDQVAVFSFASQVVLQSDLTIDRSASLAALNLLTPGGDSALNDAVMDALKLLSRSGQRSAIIVFTDGFDSSISQSSWQDVEEEADKLNIPIYLIGWRAAREDDLQNLRDLSRGDVIYSNETEPDMGWYQAALRNIGEKINSLRLQYVLNFTSTLPANGAEYELAVKAEHLGSYSETTRRFSTLSRQVVISLPNFSPDQAVGGYVKISPQVDSPAALSRVTYLVDGVETSVAQSEPFDFNWDASGYPTGPHTLTIQVVDASGNQGEFSIQLNVQPPIQVKITSPLSGETLSDSALLAAEVTALSPISSVEYFVDERSYVVLDQSPYTTTLDISGLASGLHQLKVVALTVDGFSAEDQIGVTVAVQGGFGLAWLAVIAAAAVAAVLIPMGLRRRKKIRTQPAGVESAASPGLGQGANAILRELAGANPNQVWSLQEAEVRLGRKRDENDIPLTGLRASRRHAVIRQVQGQHVVYSLNPENPILVNDSPVSQYVLQPGDILQAGDTTLRYEIS